MKNDMVEKRKLEVDNSELKGLVSISEFTFERTTVRVPGYDKDVPVSSGVDIIPEIELVFKIQRNSETMKILQDWWEGKESKDVTHIRTDGSGQEFSRELWPKCELSKFNGPGYDAASPTFAQQMIRLLPEDIKPIAAQ